jgi:hypothetical protein
MDDAALRRIQDGLNDNGYQKYCAWTADSSDTTESSIHEYCARLDSAEVAIQQVSETCCGTGEMVRLSG